jgi:hypothetical protein
MINKSPKTSMTKEIKLCEYDFSSFQISKFVDGFWSSGDNLFKEKYRFNATAEKIISFFTETLPEYLIGQNHNCMLFKSESCIIGIDYASQGSFSAKLYGKKEEVERVKQLFFQNFGELGATVEWVYNQKGDTITLPLNREQYPIKEFYPFLGEKTLEEYYDEFMNSNSSIMVLIGPSGTGKTTFLRGLICHTNGKACLSYDSRVLENDDFFANFIEDDECNILVLEDADNFIRPRKEGNMLMMKFLNIGGGLVSSSNKKIIFTTNLPSIKEIDNALIRPGRCFDILHFGKLSVEDSTVIADKLNIDHTSFTQEMTLAEIFNSKPFSSTIQHKKIGF